MKDSPKISIAIVMIACVLTNQRAFSRMMQKHRRGNVPFPKTMQVWDGVKNATVTVHMEANDKEPRYSGKVTFYSENGAQPVLIDLTKVMSNSPGINPQGKWYFGIHGYMENYRSGPFTPTLVRDIKEFDNSSNIIHMDWSDGSSNIYYPTSAGHVPLAAYTLAEVLNSMVTNGVLQKDKIHLIGFSLGGQVAGFTGKSLQGKFSWKPKRITGIDPAGPEFEGNTPSRRLDKMDGEYVEVIHCCGNILGLWNPVGHVDIYANKGRTRQPGCGYIEDLVGACSHSFCKRLYASYSKRGMKTYKCRSFSAFTGGNCESKHSSCQVGFKYPPCDKGIHYLRTKEWF